eukprot:CAMPEP_0172656278 /NCGR_PEP_ID=MMETSP1074-20121228/1262_1 /TAXON_ID=2916 /ORGANISM="Ceratium fusus, Strain PA161109" /LENGTH=286 /DNA_ID=CAMNT_0013471095 /DNA_START=13 /DNA_END=873 /DNA_ORIENTATION=+
MDRMGGSSNSGAPCQSVPRATASFGEGFAREHRAKRELITAHLPLRGMQIVPEMRSISALNLEPAVPKLDDVTISKWISFKLQLRTHQRPNLLSDFQQALEVFKRREARRHRQPSAGRSIGEATAIDAGASEAEAAGTASSPSRSGRWLRRSAVEGVRQWLGGRDGGRPTESQSLLPQGTVEPATPETLRQPTIGSTSARSQQDFGGAGVASAILEPFMEQAQREHPSTSSRQWPQATGPAYHMILGSPTGPGAEAVAAAGQRVDLAVPQQIHQAGKQPTERSAGR